MIRESTRSSGASEWSKVVLIGASAGAVEALSVVLPALPRSYPFPILVVVHLPADDNGVMVALFQAKCELRVMEALDKAPVESGTIYFAPPDYHLLVESDSRIALSLDDPVLYCRPSIDVLFESAAEAFGSKIIGIVLSGANSDGSAGLKAVQVGGGSVLVQLPSQAASSAMPLAALESCSEAQVMTLEDIANYLLEAAKLP